MAFKIPCKVQKSLEEAFGRKPCIFYMLIPGRNKIIFQVIDKKAINQNNWNLSLRYFNLWCITIVVFNIYIYLVKLYLEIVQTIQ